MDIGLKKGILIALIPLAVAACGKKKETAQPPIKRAQPAKAAPAAPPVEVKEKVVVEEAETLSAKYRNPFQSHIMLLREQAATKKIRGPLECCNFDQFKILAVVTSLDSGFALVEGPGSKRYVVKRGDAMGPREGKVVDFTQNGLVVREYVRDDSGKIVSSQDIEVNMPVKKKAGSTEDQ